MFQNSNIDTSIALEFMTEFFQPNQEEATNALLIFSAQLERKN